MKIALFGGSGQLGAELRSRAGALDFELCSPVRKEVDITESAQVRGVLENLAPDVVINAAAYTAVDKAEEERELAYAINAEGARNIAEACVGVGARLIHISTDYVFDGSLGRLLCEEDVVNQLSVYGASKLEGEKACLEILPDKSVIVRTQALYGRSGINFVSTMLQLFENREEIRVVDDQFVSPTWAGWLAEVILDLVRTEIAGVVHASNSGVVSWFEFAQTIKVLAQSKLGLHSATTILPVSAAEYKRPATRPVYSAFDTTRLEGVLKRPIMHWNRALEAYLDELKVYRKESDI